MAGSLTWRGGGGAWNAAADWNALRVPGATDAVTIDGAATLDHVDVTAADALPTVACVRAGTRIGVPGGERPVERLAIGDMMLTAGGAPRRVKWLGRRRYAASLIAAQRQLRTVRIAPGALGGGLPRRALEVSPEHALLIGGHLVPAGALFDARAENAGDVTYFHVELAAHELLLAEGVAAESFVPLAGRALFDNAAEYAAMYPEDAATAAPLPRIADGPVVARLRAALSGRPPRRAPGALRGHVERIAGGVIEGWAGDDGTAAVRLTLLADGWRAAASSPTATAPIWTTTACRPAAFAPPCRRGRRSACGAATARNCRLRRGAGGLNRPLRLRSEGAQQ